MISDKALEAAAKVLCAGPEPRSLCRDGICDGCRSEASRVIAAYEAEPERKAAMDWVLGKVDEFEREHTVREWATSQAAIATLRGDA